MIRKPTSGDSEQREREAERARKHSEISPAGDGQQSAPRKEREPGSTQKEPGRTRPAHGGSEGESAHGAIPRHGIDSDQSD